MTVEEKKLYLDFAQFIVILIGGIYAYFKIWKEGIFRPRIQFDLTLNNFEPVNGERPLEVVLIINNKGSVRRRFYSITLRIRGIRKGIPLQFWQGREPRLLFPEKLMEIQVIHKEKYGHVFVEPGVEQLLNYVTKIPADIKMISARAEFEYDNKKDHSIEKVFDLNHGK